MLLMIEMDIRGGTCPAVHKHAKENNKYMRSYNKNKEFSHIQYLDANKLYGQSLSQTLPVDGFKWKKYS